MRRLALAAALVASACAGPTKNPPSDGGATTDLTIVFDFAGGPVDAPMSSDLADYLDFGVPPAQDFAATQQDLAVVQQDGAAPQQDLAVASTDLLVAGDLAAPRDMATSSDLLRTPDLAVADLLTAPPDLFGQCDSQCPHLSFFGNVTAYQTGTGNTVTLDGGTAPASNSVTVVAQSYPPGSVKAVHLVYSLNDSTFKTPVDVVMTWDGIHSNNDQWYGIIPQEPANTVVWWYLRFDPIDGTTSQYYSNNGANWHYTSQ